LFSNGLALIWNVLSLHFVACLHLTASKETVCRLAIASCVSITALELHYVTCYSTKTSTLISCVQPTLTGASQQLFYTLQFYYTVLRCLNI